MTPLRVDVYPADAAGCGSYRCIFPARALEAEGYPVRTVMPGTEHGLRTTVRVRDGREVPVEVERPDCDVVVLQRPLQSTLVDAIPLLQAHGVAVVVELDDDFDAVHHQNVNWMKVQPLHNPWNNREHLRQACHMADLVIVSTPAIAARYGTHGRVAVIPNYVPRWYLDVERTPNLGPVCGWSGTVATHPTDLDVTGRGVGKAVARAGARFRVVGPPQRVRRKLDLWADPEASGFVALADYPAALAVFDVGIAPLAPIPFNDAKSSLKVLEYAAVGVVAVGSPVAEYRTAARAGLCLLAATPKEWERTVHRLLVSADDRAELAAKSRTAAAAYVVEDHLDEWVTAWSRALSYARTRISA